MGNHSTSGKGFSAWHDKKKSAKINNDNTVNHHEKEELARILINQGKQHEAEAIYKSLAMAGSRNYIVYANLGALLKIKGSLADSIYYYKKAIQLNPQHPITHYNLGISLQEQGDLIGAIASYNNALKLTPNYPDAHNNLGNALRAQGQLKAAINCYRNALKFKPNFPEAYYNLGITFREQADLTASIASFNNALRLKPDYYEAYYNLGISLREQGDLTASVASFNDALRLKPNYPVAHNNLGIALKEQGDLTAAIDSYNNALKLKPNYPVAFNNLGIALQEQGDLIGAIASYNNALKLKPDYPDAHYNLGIALQKQANLGGAIASYTNALKLKPDYPEAYYNLGNALQEQGDLTAAIAAYEKTLKLKPDYPDAYINLGNTLKSKGELIAAITTYHKALKLKPDYPEAFYNLGNAHQEQGDLEAAIASYENALEIKADFAGAHWNYSLTMLLNGDYKNGWEKYEWRTKKEKNPTTFHAAPKCDRWNGNDALNQTKQLLLVTEQGIGDTFQFMRYAHILRQKGAKISLCAEPKLHSLIQASGIDPSPLSPQQANQISDGQWIPLLSVPRHLKVSPENPIITEPYIKTTEELTLKWADILKTEERPIVGINWQGNPKTETEDLRGRSLPLERFAPLANTCQISFLSLQKGSGSEQMETCSFRDRFVSSQDQINETWDFLETAAIIENCDLVITSDTSVAHLAGGMGKTTWLLLHKIPDWRWGMHSNTTFWYPSMRLFRQTERGNWNEVMERVTEALHKQLGESSTNTIPITPIQPTVMTKSIQDILAPISLGELIDKITILQIKTQYLQGTALENVEKELSALQSTLNTLDLNIEASLIKRLKEVNQALWKIEDDIRDQERQQKFGETFIHLARSVYQQNDRRAAIKKQINTIYGSSFVEEKSYNQY